MGAGVPEAGILCLQPAARPHRMQPQPPQLGAPDAAPQGWGWGCCDPLWKVLEPQGMSVSSGWTRFPALGQLGLGPQHL